MFEMYNTTLEDAFISRYEGAGNVNEQIVTIRKLSTALKYNPEETRLLLKETSESVQ